MATSLGLVEDNIRFLQQGVDLLGHVDDVSYSRCSPTTFGSGVGAHLRHCIDHYTNFLSGLPQGRIDYDARLRDVRLETDRLFAVRKMREILAQMAALRSIDADKPLEIKMDCNEEIDQEDDWSHSTFHRELQFLVSHTVHHYALIRMTLRFQGVDAQVDFGMAPSTLRYNQNKAACAQ